MEESSGKETTTISEDQKHKFVDVSFFKRKHGGDCDRPNVTER